MDLYRPWRPVHDDEPARVGVNHLPIGAIVAGLVVVVSAIVFRLYTNPRLGASDLGIPERYVLGGDSGDYAPEERSVPGRFATPARPLDVPSSESPGVVSAGADAPEYAETSADVTTIEDRVQLVDHEQPYVGLPGAPVYSFDDFATAIATARSDLGLDFVFPSDHRGLATGTFPTRDALARIGILRTLDAEFPMARGGGWIEADQFASLCQLAETATFVSLDAAVDRRELRDQVIQVVAAVVGDEDNLPRLGRMAAFQIGSRDRATNGVILVGTVLDAANDVRGYHSCRMMLFGLPHEVQVVTPFPLKVKPKQHVVVLGSIVDDPARRLEAFDGGDEAVVWCGLNPVGAMSR